MLTASSDVLDVPNEADGEFSVKFCGAFDVLDVPSEPYFAFVHSVNHLSCSSSALWMYPVKHISHLFISASHLFISVNHLSCSSSALWMYPMKHISHCHDDTIAALLLRNPAA
jgi:hypothetical protein